MPRTSDRLLVRGMLLWHGRFRVKEELMTHEARVVVSIEQSTATVLLDNPGQYNALTKNMCLQLLGAFASLAADRTVTTIVVRGANSSFCSGIAIDQMDRVLEAS